MLTAVNGHIDDNRVIVDENIADWQGKCVVVTILDSNWDGQISRTENQMSDDKGKKAAQELAGLWKDHEDDLTVEETVRNMRRGRCFDN